MSDNALFAARAGTREEFYWLAADYLAGRGIVDVDEEGTIEDGGYLAEVMDVLDRRSGEVIALYEDVYCRDVQQVVDLWEQERYDDWQRHEAPRWRCPCGREYGVQASFKPDRPALYSLTDDGLFDELVAHYPATYGRSGEPKCPCGLAFYATLAAMLKGKIEPGQMALDFGA